jgi:hypothetical protein
MKKILSVEQEIEIGNLYVSKNITTYEIADMYCVSPSVVQRAIRKHGFPMRKKTPTYSHSAWERADEVVADYCGETMTFDEIKKKYNASHLTIWRITDSRGIPRREHQVTSDAGREVCMENGRKRNIYPVDSTFFDDIDSEEKAYWWGFIYADGYVGGDARALVINLGNADRTHLEKFRDAISPNRPVRLETKFRKHLGITTNTAVLRVDDKRVGLRLQTLGIIPKRTDFTRVKDNLPEDMFVHWLRGYFDGDGTAGKDIRHPSIRILGQEDLLQWILDELNSRGVLHTLALPYQKGGKNGTKINIYELSIGGSRQLVSFRSWLYKDATVYLERKKDIADTWRIKR